MVFFSKFIFSNKPAARQRVAHITKVFTVGAKFIVRYRDVAVVAVVGIDAELIDDFEGVLAPVHDVHQRVIEQVLVPRGAAIPASYPSPLSTAKSALFS